MVTMIEPPLETNQLQLTDQYRLDFDKHNIILTKKYRKREGKGANAPFSNIWGYGEPKYFGIRSLRITLAEREFMNELSEMDMSKVNGFIEAIDKAIEAINKVDESVNNTLREKVTIDLGDTGKGKGRKVKGVEVATEEGDE